ncbi:MAG TPA: D-glycero-beta-D-manno-heptose 1-phosphate adenylyltransferase [Fimbriimonas sp.]
MTLAEALDLRRNKRLVFTNGVFDILHSGHVVYLTKAAALGDLLIVGVNSDASVRRLGKGPDRPVNPLEDRMVVLEGLKPVAGAVPFDEDTPEGLIRQLMPEVHVKGGDYRIEDLPEAQLVRSYGGEVVILPLRPGRSTTQTLRRLGLE